ncbi:hypothetical protein EX30DRAFT_269412 [Ascodesmis nigricans]|uniref:Uncharacterized protein n=1 Tax=Ascodesmis nigricans TaxID=341454 RepID=A0A4S2MX08_9PEZI|nr:hypothetical protein EX30DRAFT_269412 [Ascodesmis nigricans]
MASTNFPCAITSTMSIHHLHTPHAIRSIINVNILSPRPSSAHHHPIHTDHFRDKPPRCMLSVN